MRIDVTIELKDFTGSLLREGDKVWTVGEVLKAASMCAPINSNQAPYSSDEQIKRYQFAFSIHNAEDRARGGRLDEESITVEVTAEMAAKLKIDIARLFGPIIAGQVLPLLDGR